MLTSLCVLQMLRILQRPHTRRDAALLGALLGLAALAKLSGVIVWAIGAATWFFLARKTGNWKSAIWNGALCFGIALALVATWVASNLLRYAGDPFAWSAYRAIASVRETPISNRDWVDIALALVTSFWGRFGGALQIELPRAVYAASSAASLIAFLGWLGLARDAFKRQIKPQIQMFFILFASFWTILLVAYVRWAHGDLAAGQARLLFPGLPLLAIFLTVGLARVFAARRTFALAVWSIGWLAPAVGALIFLNSIYAPPMIDLARLPRLDAPAPADFGHTIRIVDYRVEKKQAALGDSIDVQLYWQALQAPSQNYWLLLQLAGKDDRVVNQDGVPSAGRLTTDWWQKNQVLTSRHTIQIPRDLPAGTYTLRLGLHPFGNWDWLPVRGQEMLTLEKIEIIAPN
jgi:hypothetical protein